MYDALSLNPDDRRTNPRFPLRTYMKQYVQDVPYQALALDVSEDGLAIRKPTERIPHARVVGLELELPGTSEIIWASAEPRLRTKSCRVFPHHPRRPRGKTPQRSPAIRCSIGCALSSPHSLPWATPN